MLKMSLGLLFILFTLTSSRGISTTFLAETIKLPSPNTTAGMPIYEAMNIRHSSRDFVSGTDLTNEELSQLLWLGYGKKENGHRSPASSKGKYPFDVYVFMRTGVYKYLPEPHELELITNRDFRGLTGNDAYVTNASINVVFVGVLEREDHIKEIEPKKMSCDLDAGHAAQHFLLYAVSQNLKCVPRLNFVQSGMLSILGLDEQNYYIPLCLSIGK